MDTNPSIRSNEDIFYEILDDVAASYDLNTWSEIFAEFNEVERAIAIHYGVTNATEVIGFVEWREALRS